MPNELILLLFISFCGTAKAQNLVVNPDFETVNICHKYKESCSPLGWRSTSLKLFGYDKDNINGSYISLQLFDLKRTNSRKYAQTELICPLEQGQDYLISLQVKPDQFRIDQIHVGFQDSIILSANEEFVNLRGKKATLKVSKEIKQGDWIALETTYRAIGGEKYLIIGNLLRDSLTEVDPIDKKKYQKYLKTYASAKRVTYGIDQVKIIPLDSGVEICENHEIEKNRISKDSVRHTLIRIGQELIRKEVLVPDQSMSVQSTPVQPIDISKVSEDKRIDLPKKRIINDVNFQFDEAKLIAASIEALDEIAAVMNAKPETNAYITGYTDSNGSEEYNLRLSLQRAIAVKEYLVSHNVSATRLVVEGKGEKEPIATGEDEGSRQLNRRVEITLFYRQ